jgi:ankyrin repeat protein
MFLAALFMAEKIGFALMTRYMIHPMQIRQRLVDARDNAGQTILAIAILSGCTFEFIEALVVECCANVDPDPMRNVLSPLQAAAIRGRKDVAILLLSYGAQDNNTYFDELSASALARHRGHTDIKTLIVAETCFQGGNIPG